MGSPRIITEVLARHLDLYTVALGVFYPGHGHVKIDGGHDTVAKFLLDQRLERGAVDAHDLIERQNQLGNAR